MGRVWERLPASQTILINPVAHKRGVPDLFSVVMLFGGELDWRLARARRLCMIARASAMTKNRHKRARNTFCLKRPGWELKRIARRIDEAGEGRGR